MNNVKKRRIPRFKNENEEREFWASHDSTEYYDWSEAKKGVMPKPKPTLKIISIRLLEIMREERIVLANKKDGPYQSLMKIFLAERVEQEIHKY